MPKQFYYLFLLFLSTGLRSEAPVMCYDIVVYGGTSAGVIAAVQAAKMGNSVALIEPGMHLGGMTSSGLGWVDLSNPQTIGGLAREYFHRVWKHYRQDSAWLFEEPRPIKGQLYSYHHEDQLMWVLEPHVGERIFEEMAQEAGVVILRKERLQREEGVTMRARRIRQIAMESGLVIIGKMFIDASYEGDLMAAAGVSYIVGREPNQRYRETLNGILRNIPSPKHQLKIDPYLVKGEPCSGLLPRVEHDQQQRDGDGDPAIQAYNYRMCLTDVPENRILVEKPRHYDEKEYEILFRAIEAGISPHGIFKLDLLPNRKTDSNNNGPISTDYVGMSWQYPEASYQKREEIAAWHQQWQIGLLWTLQHHPRIPKEIRAHYAPWGLPKDEFIDNNHWPYQLYIREARRMLSSVIIDEHTAMGATAVYDSVGIASYCMDSHLTRYIVLPNGFLGTDGGMYKKIPKPYPISYQAIIPSSDECNNLLVPVCLSATHAAYGSIRMEPTFMVLGQSAATAASLAIRFDLDLQELHYGTLYQQLRNDGQLLFWNK